MATFGVMLNLGEQLGEDHAAVFRLALQQAELAEALGYHDAWVTEHHFIPFGINSNALTLAAALIGRTRRLRVGTAVTLAPQYHPLQLAEQAAILDQVSRGRFDFGVGRGGYAAEFEAFGIDPARWDDEIEETLAALVHAWTSNSEAFAGRWHQFGPLRLTPSPLTRPHPPLFAATAAGAGLERAAAVGAPLLHYFATPVSARQQVEAAYAAASPADAPRPAHVHTLILHVTDDARTARRQLQEALTESFRQGDWPAVPQSEARRAAAHGAMSVEERARRVAEGALVGDPAAVAQDLQQFISATGAERLVLYFEAIGSAPATLSSLERFAGEVRPLLELAGQELCDTASEQ